jgi:hypothetical protein
MTYLAKTTFWLVLVVYLSSLPHPYIRGGRDRGEFSVLSSKVTFPKKPLPRSSWVVFKLSPILQMAKFRNNSDRF